MKRKVCLIAVFMLMAFHVLPISSVFAADNTTPASTCKPSINLSVNNEKNVRIDVGENLTFSARVSCPNVNVDTVSWSSEFDDYDFTASSTLDNEGAAVLSLTYAEIAPHVSAGSEYKMQVSYNTGEKTLTDVAGFGIVGENPVIVFADPYPDSETSINDPIHFEIATYAGTNSTSMTVTWTCSDSSRIAAGYTCPGASAEEADIAYKTVGVYTITVTVADQDNKSGSASSRIFVVNDAPEIELTTDKNVDSYEVGDTATVSVSASDKFGTVKKIMWGCSSDGNIAYDSEEVFDPSPSSLNTDVTINLPNVETNNFECSFKAIDDDNEEGVASVTFTANLPAQQTGGDDDNVNTPPTEPTEPTEPNGNVEPIVSPNTGAVMKDGRSAEEDIIMPIVVSAAVFVTVAVFATIFTLEKNQKL